MLLFGKKLTAQEACAQGLVTEVFPDGTFQKEVWARLKAYSKLPPNVSIQAFVCLFVFNLQELFASNRQLKKKKTHSLALSTCKSDIKRNHNNTSMKLTKWLLHFWDVETEGQFLLAVTEEADQPPLLGLLAWNPGEQADR